MHSDTLSPYSYIPEVIHSDTLVTLQLHAVTHYRHHKVLCLQEGALQPSVMIRLQPHQCDRKIAGATIAKAKLDVSAENILIRLLISGMDVASCTEQLLLAHNSVQGE